MLRSEVLCISPGERSIPVRVNGADALQRSHRGREATDLRAVRQGNTRDDSDPEGVVQTNEDALAPVIELRSPADLATAPEIRVVGATRSIPVAPQRALRLVECDQCLKPFAILHQVILPSSPLR